MPNVTLYTYRDALDHALNFLGADVSAQATTAARSAVLAAYREIASARRWVYYYHRGRIVTSASQSSSTIAYDHTGGTYERQLTLASGSWPTWATFGVVVIANIPYEVAEYKTSSIITLSATSNPGADVAAGTSYVLYRDTYPLPADCLAIDRLRNMSQTLFCAHAHPRDWLSRQQIYHNPAAPNLYTVMGEPNYQNVICLRFHPAPDQAYSFDFIYQRRPRPLVVDEYNTGTLTVSADSASVTGSATAWASKHVGCSLRVYDTANYPTGLAGAYPFLEERVVMERTSATAVTVDTAFTDGYTAVKYVLSDPVDIEEGAMLTAFLRCVEKELMVGKRMKDRPAAEVAYFRALKMAMEADNRVFERRAVGHGPWSGFRWSDMPTGDDVEV